LGLSLKQLLEQCDPKAPLSPEDQEWLNGPAAGRSKSWIAVTFTT
jgi:hypothetical protein